MRSDVSHRRVRVSELEPTGLDMDGSRCVCYLGDVVRLHVVVPFAKDSAMNFWIMVFGCTLFGIDMGFWAGFGLFLVAIALESELSTNIARRK